MLYLIQKLRKEMIKMMEWICAIPDSIGWTLVGIAGTLCAVMMWKLGKLFVEMWREWHEEDCEA